MNEKQIQAIATIIAEILRLGIRDFGIDNLVPYYGYQPSGIRLRLNVMGNTKMHSFDLSISSEELEEETCVDWIINSKLKLIAMELGAACLRDADKV